MIDLTVVDLVWVQGTRPPPLQPLGLIVAFLEKISDILYSVRKGNIIVAFLEKISDILNSVRKGNIIVAFLEKISDILNSVTKRNINWH